MTTSSSVGEGSADLTPQQSLVLGVDGGGTKTLAWLAQVDQQGAAQTIGRGVAGSSNQVAAGWKTASSNLTRAIEHAFADARLSTAPITSAVFALAGSGTPEAEQQVREFVDQNFQIESVRVVHDGQAVLLAGTPNGWGVALIAGTGAVAYGANQQSVSAVVGGWGYWFGDEGSAYWLGQSALRAVSQAEDGRGQQTALTATILEHLETKEPREMLAVLSSRGDVRLEIADLAEVVCQVAEQQDEVANQLVSQAAEHWSRHIACLAERLMPGQEFPLALAGGVLCGSKFAREKLLNQLAFNQILTTSVELVAEPVVGCLQLACRELPNTG